MKKYIIICYAALLCLVSCKSSQIAKTNAVQKTSNTVKKVENSLNTDAPDWAKDAILYEVNVRQFSKEGTFAAVEKDIPRLKQMGVDIIWLMPIHPIGKEKRKGTEGSYYSVKDYMKIHEDYGDMEDLQSLVKTVHTNDMHIIIDWVANHSAWDNWMVSKHPEWYTLKDGKMIPPVDDWSDVADLNFENAKFRAYMIEAMQYWVKVADIDGFRCDVAEMVPFDFWKTAIAKLNAMKPLFMLAEAENPELHEVGFHATYSWELHHLLNQVAQGKKGASDLKEYTQKSNERFQPNDYRLNFTSNHDENSWNGSVFERMGDAHKCLSALTYALPGMPLIYSGQEAPMKKRLEFFEKDPINWNNYEYAKFYQKLNDMKHRNSALWNGKQGGDIQFIDTSKPTEVLAFVRRNKLNQKLFVFNLSNKEVNVEIKDETFTKLAKTNRLKIKAWDYRMY